MSVVSIILFWMGWGLHVQHQIVFLAFLTGGFFSGLQYYRGRERLTALEKDLSLLALGWGLYSLVARPRLEDDPAVDTADETA